VESTTDLLEGLIEKEQKIRERAEELGLKIGKKESLEEAKAPFRAKEGIPRTELTDKELARLFAEIKDILDIYTKDYIAEHFDEAHKVYESLKDRPFDPDSLVGSRIAQKIQELKERIDAVKEEESPTKALENFLQDVKRLVDHLDTYDEELAKRKYYDLLKRQQDLPKNVNSRIESEIEEYLIEIGKKLQRTEKRSAEDIGEELLEEIGDLIGSNTFRPEQYNKVAKKFQNVSDGLPADLRLKIRDRIRECYAKMKDIEKKEEVKKYKKEKRAKKFYWDSFVQDVEQLKAELEKASPGEFFRLHDFYNQILDSLEDADLSDVPTAQVERVKSLVEQCYYMLENLRSRA
jgi:hypothetical protein